MKIENINRLFCHQSSITKFVIILIDATKSTEREIDLSYLEYVKRDSNASNNLLEFSGSSSKSEFFLLNFISQKYCFPIHIANKINLEYFTSICLISTEISQRKIKIVIKSNENKLIRTFCYLKVKDPKGNKNRERHNRFVCCVERCSGSRCYGTETRFDTNQNRRI